MNVKGSDETKIVRWKGIVRKFFFLEGYASAETNKADKSFADQDEL